MQQDGATWWWRVAPNKAEREGGMVGGKGICWVGWWAIPELKTLHDIIDMCSMW